MAEYQPRAIFTDHAYARCVERFPETANFGRLTLEKILPRVYYRGVVYGDSYTDCSYFVKGVLGNKPIVFVVKKDQAVDVGLIITTVLTLDECHHNGGFRSNGNEQPR